MQKRDNLIPETFLPLHAREREREGDRETERETTGSFSMRSCRTKLSALLFIPSLPPSLPIPALRSVCLLSRSPGSVNFPRKLPDLDERNEGTVSDGGERRDGERRGEERGSRLY